MPLIIAATVALCRHRFLAYMDDFMKKLAKARQMRGFRYIHVYTHVLQLAFPAGKNDSCLEIGGDDRIFTFMKSKMAN